MVENRPGTQVNRNRPPVSPGQAVPPDKILAGEAAPLEVARMDEQLRARAVAFSQLIIHRSADETVDLVGQTRNPIAAVPVVAVNVVTYQVPIGMVAVFDQIGITYSDPMVPMTQSVGWQLTINGLQVPNVQQTNPGQEYFWWSAGEVNNPMQMRELWVQQRETIQVQIYATNGFDEQLTVTGRLSGRIYKPGTPEVIM